MQLKTILNQVYRLPGFVYGRIRLVPAEEEGERPHLEVEMRSRAICSGCSEHAPGYDRLRPRLFRFVPVLGVAVYFVYAMRRVQCVRCGKVKVERVPWADGKQRSTKTLDWFLAEWAGRLSWKETAEVFGVSWDRVRRAVAMAVAWGRERVVLQGITTIGVDEIAWQSGHRYLTLVYQLDAGCRRLLWVGLPTGFTEMHGSNSVESERYTNMVSSVEPMVVADEYRHLTLNARRSAAFPPKALNRSYPGSTG